MEKNEIRCLCGHVFQTGEKINLLKLFPTDNILCDNCKNKVLGLLTELSEKGIVNEAVN
jgi:hypothetical protein